MVVCLSISLYNYSMFVRNRVARTSQDKGQDTGRLSKEIGVKLCNSLDGVYGASEKLTFALRRSINSVAGILFKMLSQRAAMKTLRSNMDSLVGVTTKLEPKMEEVDGVLQKLNGEILSSGVVVEQFGSSVKNVAEEVSSKVSTIDELAAATGEGIGKVTRVLDVINVLSQNVDAIRDVISAINDISERTNLLAMNAAIEAAHAGKAGLGFAVVAGEIRKLSEGTKANSANIEKTLKSMLDSLADVRKTADEAGSAMKWIGGKVEETRESFQEVAQDMDQLASNSRDVSMSVRQVSDLSKQTKDYFGVVVANVKEMMGGLDGGSQIFDEIRGRQNDIFDLLGGDFYDMNEMLNSNLDIDVHSRQQSVSLGECSCRYSRDVFPFTEILIKHLSWVTKVRALLDGRISAEGATLGDHHSCALGQWIDNKAESAGVTSSQNFQVLLKEHEALHGIVQQVYRTAKIMTEEEKERKFSELLEKSNAVIDCLVKLRSSIG